MTQRRDSVFINRIENEPGDQPRIQSSRQSRLSKILALLALEVLLSDEEDVE